MIAIAMMKIRRVVVGRFWIRVRERREIATRLMWMPGIRPVRVPARIPRTRGRIRFSIYFRFQKNPAFALSFSVFPSSDKSLRTR